MTNGSIKGLIFDYGGVLMRTFDPRPRRELELRFDLEPGRVYDLVFGSPRWDDAQHGRIDSDGFWTDLGERLDLGEERLAAFRREFWRGDRVDEELVDLIRHLQRLGYRTALLSNAPPRMGEFIEELGIADAFDVMVVSGDEGITKPAPQIYERALDQMEMTASEVVFVDDTRANVEAARHVGLRATRFHGLAPLRVWLQELDVRLPQRSLEPVPNLQAIIFDWGGVMEELPNEADVAAWERRLGLASGVLPEVLWGRAWNRLKVGALSDEEYVEQVTKQLDLPGSGATLDFLQAFYTSDRLNANVLRAARALRKRYRVALLSNAFPAQMETILDQYGVDVEAEFDAYVNSAIVGMSKPDPGIFYVTLERLGVAPEQAILVDDTLRNVDAARGIGLHAVQFVSPQVSLPDLEALLGHRIEA